MFVPCSISFAYALISLIIFCAPFLICCTVLCVEFWVDCVFLASLPEKLFTIPTITTIQITIESIPAMSFSFTLCFFYAAFILPLQILQGCVSRVPQAYPHPPDGCRVLPLPLPAFCFCGPSHLRMFLFWHPPGQWQIRAMR